MDYPVQTGETHCFSIIGYQEANNLRREVKGIQAIQDSLLGVRRLWRRNLSEGDW